MRGRSRGGVAGFLDRRADGGVVDRLASNEDELRLEVGAHGLDAGNLGDLSLDGRRAVAAVHRRDGVHGVHGTEYTPPGYLARFGEG